MARAFTYALERPPPVSCFRIGGLEDTIAGGAGEEGLLA
jgi:hypothetical protein